MTFPYIKKHSLEIVILLVTIYGTFLTWQSQALQKQIAREDAYPFFKYEYSDGVFRVTGGEKTDVTQVEWVMPTRSLNQDGRWELLKIGHHPTRLGYYDIRDYLAREIGVGRQDEGESSVECSLYLFDGGGIPAIVSVTYDKNNSQGLINRDFVFITRLDTSIPEVIVQPGGRNIDEPTAIDLLNNHLEWFDAVITGIREHGGACGLIMNQPLEGYVTPPPKP